MKSCTSTRRPAWAPPPKICTSGSGRRSRRARRRDSARAAGPGAAAAWATAIEVATSALPPRRARFARAVEPTSAASIPAWSAACAAQQVGDLAVDGGQAPRTSKPPNARRRRAIHGLGAAGGGAGRAMARPIGAAGQRTSASTVGRPRESQTRRPRTEAMVSFMRRVSRFQAASTAPSSRRGGQQAARSVAHCSRRPRR